MYVSFPIPMHNLGSTGYSLAKGPFFFQRWLGLKVITDSLFEE